MSELQYWDGDTPKDAHSADLRFCRECDRFTVCLEFRLWDDSGRLHAWTRCQDCLEAEIERYNATVSSARWFGTGRWSGAG